MIRPRDMDIQIPLIPIVESDGSYFDTHGNVSWFDLLRDFGCLPWRPVARE